MNAAILINPSPSIKHDAIVTELAGSATHADQGSFFARSLLGVKNDLIGICVPCGPGVAQIATDDLVACHHDVGALVAVSVT